MVKKNIIRVPKDNDDFSEEEVDKALKDLVKEGLLAYIISNDGNKTDVQYINASQVIVKCPHCSNLVNVGKKNPHPSSDKEIEEEVIEGIESGIKKGFIKEVSSKEDRKFKISDKGLLHIRKELKIRPETRLFLWNLIYNFKLKESKSQDYNELLMESIYDFIKSEGLWEIIDDICNSIKEGNLKGIKIEDYDKFKEIVRIYVEAKLELDKKGVQNEKTP